MLKITRTHWPLQVARWGIHRLRQDFEKRITDGWDRDLSLNLDAVHVIDDLLQHLKSVTGVR